MEHQAWAEKSGAHYYEIHGPYGVGSRAFTWGSEDQIARDLAIIYKEPILRRVFAGSGEIRAIISSPRPITYVLGRNGLAVRLTETINRLHP